MLIRGSTRHALARNWLRITHKIELPRQIIAICTQQGLNVAIEMQRELRALACR